MDGANKIEWLAIDTIMFFIIAYVSDLCLFGLFGLLIPGVGLAIAAFVIGAHIFWWIVIGLYIGPKTHGWLPKLFLVLGLIMPLSPMLFWAILTSNSALASFITEQVAIQTVAIATAGGGELIEGAAVVTEGGEILAEGTQAIETGAETISQGAEIGEGAGGFTDTTVEAGTGEGGLEASTEAPETADEMAAREEGNPMENLQEDLEEPREEGEFEEDESEELEDQEEEKKENKAAERVKKVIDIANRTNRPREEEDSDEEDLKEAA